MRWILVVKDHAPGFLYLCALPRKQTDLVAFKLEKMFGVIWLPQDHALKQWKRVQGKYHF
jgi:hypothetical protein